MRPVYAVRFELRELSPGGLPAVCGRARELVGDWVRTWYAERKELTLSAPLAGGVLEPIPLHRIEVSDAAASTGERLWSLTWSYPPESDDTILWQSNVVLADAGNAVEGAIILRLASRDFVVAPLTFTVRRPRILKTLLTTFPCYLGGRPLGVTPQPIDRKAIDAFAASLFEAKRRLPVVLFSRDPYSDQALAEPALAADALAGLADVFVLNDKWAGFKLTDVVGQPFSCFNGAVRIYWPGLSKGDSPFAHTLFMPDRVRQYEGDQGLANHLLRRIAPVSAVRFVESETVRKVRGALAADRSREAAHIRSQIAAGAVAEEELETQVLNLLAEKEVFEKRIKDLEKERDDAGLRTLELEEENQQLKDNIRAISAYQPHPTTAVSEQQLPEPSSIREALDFSASDFADRLEVCPNAERSADDSAFPRPKDVYQALMAIRDIADTYFVGRQGGPPVGPWEAWFEQRGFKYAATESQNTLNMYGNARDFTHRGRTLRMVRHLTLGGGDRTNCLQIYFEVDESTERFLIGYCGVHLPYYGMRT